MFVLKHGMPARFSFVFIHTTASSIMQNPEFLIFLTLFKDIFTV